MKLSLRFKVSALVLLLVTPLFLFLYYTNIYSINIVREKVAKSASDTLTLHLGTLDELLEQTSHYLLRTANENMLLELYSDSGPDSVNYYLSIRKLMDQWYSDVSYYTIIRSVFVYHLDRDELFLSSQKEYYQEKDMITSGLSSRLKASKLPASLKWEIVTIGGEPVLFKALPDKSGRLLVGILVSIDSLAQPLTHLESTGGGEQIGIISNDGALLWGQFAGADLALIRNHLNDPLSPSGASIRLSNGNNYLLIDKPSLYSDLNVFILLDEKSILDELPRFQRIINAIPIAIIIILAILLAMLSRLVFKPIQHFISGMRILGKGQLDYRLKEGNSKEFQIITQQFNQMAEQIGNLKIDVYEEQMKVQQAELKHLQAQINPHFFMNSLNIVFHLVELQKYSLIKKMIGHLVSYFRFIMNTNDTWITLSSELNHIRNYIEIQMVMYPDKLTYQEQLPKELEHTLIPPLLIQPFVENAMKHGFINNTKPFEVVITVGEEAGTNGDSCIAIQIKDSGPGFSERQLEMLNLGVYEKKPTDRHLGIWNVYRRMMMFYDNRARLAFHNAPEGGGVVEIRLPIQRGL
ncbi:sensor histidine kinase [Paenibacillus tianjinensis]|uniref:Histidine kinase n=1 Tax=Paenibacillus tianjinensis TaxID=2810347 RepID=A0ABX7LCF6_9BACL|nr:histidine kinase [Paenibacillus tianjinensis]QSF45056.1 histidine kinase [Paenibacillus tianjinensis]